MAATPAPSVVKAKNYQLDRSYLDGWTIDYLRRLSTVKLQLQLNNCKIVKVYRANLCLIWPNHKYSNSNSKLPHLATVEPARYINNTTYLTQLS